MQIVGLTYLLSGALIVVVSIPLVFRKVPMNRWYGMRTKLTFASEEAWFHLNQVGGALVAMTALPLLLAGGIAFLIPEEKADAFAILSALGITGSILLALALFLIYSASYRKTSMDSVEGKKA